MELTNEQKQAISAMNKALKLCHKSGLSLALMDSSLIFATNNLLEENPSFGSCYVPTADAYRALQENGEEKRTGAFNIPCGLHIDGGGW